MVFFVQLVIFLAALFTGKKFTSLVIAVASLFVPDEIPMVDEILMLAAVFRS